VPPALAARYGARLIIKAKFNELDEERLRLCLEAEKSVTFRFAEVIETTRTGAKKARYDADGKFQGYETAIYCYASFDDLSPVTEITTSLMGGAIGIDFNADHFAVVETDSSGNPVHHYSLPFSSAGKSAAQRNANSAYSAFKMRSSGSISAVNGTFDLISVT
jgi:hypothetical protein